MWLLKRSVGEMQCNVDMFENAKTGEQLLRLRPARSSRPNSNAVKSAFLDRAKSPSWVPSYVRIV